MRAGIDNWFDRLEEAVRENQAEHEAIHGVPQPLDGEQIEGWFDSAHNPLREKMEREHPWRWARLLRDLKWIRKEMVKLGLNPNDVKWWVR